MSGALPPDHTMLAQMARAELRLAAREPLVLSFVFAFPVVLVLVLGGIFDEGDTPIGDGNLHAFVLVAMFVASTAGCV